MAMTRNFVDAVIKRGWKPYIKSHWMKLGSKSKGGVIITFEGHEEHEYRCSSQTANNILSALK